MSTYRPESEISAFNALAADTWFSVSADFLTVLNSALEIGAYSGGAYDVTVAPLVDLWGFGPDMRLSGFPRSEEIQDGLKNVGQDRIRIDDRKSALLKTSALALDFSSIAKGYAVDVVAQWLSMQRIDNYLVEVGGEMRLKGLSGRGDPWRIAIERPQAQPQARGGVVAQALALSDVAVATSGDYRNFFEHEGQRYSHTIDPRTGYPVIHDLVSVTVLHSSAMVADAWATALTVLGPKDAMAVALEQGLAVYFIQRQGDGFLDSHTEAFEPYLEGDK